MIDSSHLIPPTHDALLGAPEDMQLKPGLAESIPTDGIGRIDHVVHNRIEKVFPA